jgi:hypothetical protein
MAAPTIADVERISAEKDAVIRNLQITQCYHELSLALSERTGRSANWCTFATWASKQAGQTIRKEDLGRALERLVRGEQSAQMAAQELAVSAQQSGIASETADILKAIWRAWNPAAAFDRSSDAVGRGNLKVFSEIGRQFARFFADCLPDTIYDEGRITRFCAELCPGEPPEGQRYLSQAFQRYYQALFETQPKAQIELLLLANLEIGFHEQTRLQPEINEALNAPLIDPKEFARRLQKELHPGRGVLNDLVWYISHLFGRRTPLDGAIEGFVAAVRRQAQFLITETLMVIELPPRRVLRLGDDLASGFPPLLQQITLPDLRRLLAQIDPTADSPRHSGADYWGDLPDRLHFIADLFRSYEMSPELFEPPFTEEQTIAVRDGRLPSGRL